MDVLTIIAIFLIVWGVATLSVGAFKPQKVWQIGKIQGFVQLLSERGTTIFFVIVGLVAMGAGIWILLV